MYDRVGLYRGKKSLCCVNNSKRHLTKRFMGYSGRYRSLHGQGLFPEHPHDADGTDYDGEPSKAAEVCQK